MGLADDLKLLAIAGPPVVEPPRLVEACRAAVEGGVTAVQVRVKHASAADLLHLTEALRATLAVPVWVNDRADVALAAGAYGVHVGADDLPPTAVRALAGDALHVGVSVGTPEEAEAVTDGAVDYWSIGSIYATTTKPDAGAPIGAEGFRRLASLAPSGMPVIAIGGIGANNAGEIIRAGAVGVAVSSAVFGVGDVREAARRLRDAVDDALS
jgi:thiamine-phosphate pyrophosphorylase